LFFGLFLAYELSQARGAQLELEGVIVVGFAGGDEAFGFGGSCLIEVYLRFVFERVH
jgi:hypothetical protein